MAGVLSKDDFSALYEVRDRALMLSLGNAHLCEDFFLRKFGAEMDAILGDLRNEITSFKTRFPGKFTDNGDVDRIIEELGIQARKLQEPDGVSTDRCAAGTLGKELEESIQTFTAAVKALVVRIEGEPPAYTRKDSLLNFFDMFKRAGSLFSGTVRLAFKGVILLLVLATGTFVYLFVTMDREAVLLNNIRESEIFIHSQGDILSQIETERNEISRKIESLRETEARREEKVAIMELGVTMHGLDQKRHKLEVEISAQEEGIKEKQKRFQEMKGKSSVERLLRY